MQQVDQILHLASGGTIDSHWDGSADTAVPNRESIIPDYLQNVARLENVDSETLFLKDSRQITLADQDRIAERVADCSRKRLLLTIGTYLMPDVARVISRHPASKSFDLLDKRVAITGSIKPILGFLMSDGGFNLGMSVAVLQENLKSRISVVMNGASFEANDIRKDLSSATFSGVEAQDQLAYESCDLITVGGSMDFLPNGLDELVPGNESFVSGFLRESVKTRKQVFTVNPFLKDSRELSEKDLADLLKMVKGSRTKHVVLTVGIYRMNELARFLVENLPKNNRKVILLTGARLPLSFSDMTDAPFNLGYTFGKLGFLKPGVHITLNGKVLSPADDVVSAVYLPHEIELLKQRHVIG